MNRQFGGFPGDFHDENDDDPDLPSGTPDDDGVVRLNKPKAKKPKASRKRAIKPKPKKRTSPARRRRGTDA
jgi:hypothetical protein